MNIQIQLKNPKVPTMKKKIFQSIKLCNANPRLLQCNRRCITELDIPKLAMLLRGRDYFGVFDSDWVNIKEEGGEDFSDPEVQRIMKKCKAREDEVFARRFRSKQGYIRGCKYISDCGIFLTTLDVHDVEENIIIDIRAEEEFHFNEFKNGTNLEFYALAFKMYMMKAKHGRIIACLLDNDDEEVVIEIDTESHYYKWVEENIHVFVLLHACFHFK